MARQRASKTSKSTKSDAGDAPTKNDKTPPERSRTELETWLDGFLRDPSFLEAYPYYVAILGRLTPVADPSVKRMAVSLHDGRFYLHVNVDAFANEPQFLRGVLLHEVHHVVLGHLTHPKFAEAAEPELMDLAVEMSANEHIEELLPPAITWRAYSAFGIRPGQSTIDRYEILVRYLQEHGSYPSPAQNEQGKSPIDDHRALKKGQKVPGGVAQTAILLGRAVADAQQERSSKPTEGGKDPRGNEDQDDPKLRRNQVAGKTPGELIEELSETLREPEEMIDWRAALEMFIARARSPIHTWSRPNRRFPGRVFDVPGRSWTPRRVEQPRLLVAIDTSLSMSRLELEETARHLAVLSERAHITIAECDASIARVYPFGGKIETIMGRGGTDLRPVFAESFLGAHDIDGVIYFTDGDGPYPKEPSPVPTLWVLTKPQAFACPWGQRAKMMFRR